jgi:hypothetical protein
MIYEIRTYQLKVGSPAERTRVHDESARDPNWPPKIQEFILDMQSEILLPASCSRVR